MDKDHPLLGPRVASFAGAAGTALMFWFPDAWFIGAGVMVVGAIPLLHWVVLRIADRQRTRGANKTDVTPISPLQIVLGAHGDFEASRNHQIYTNRHTFSVAIRNAHPSAFISNCKLHLEIAKPGAPPQSFLLVDTFTLNAGEDRFVPIVSYDESIPPHPAGGAEMRLLILVLGQGYNVGHGWPWQIPVGSYSFVLKLTARGHAPVSAVCNAWVDANGALHFVRASEVTASEYMSWADLVRHVVLIKWGSAFDPDNHDQVMEMLENIRDQFSLLVLEAQGRREAGDGQVGAMEFIETKGFWDRALWHYGKGIPLNDARLPSSVWHNREIYRDVRVKRADVLRVWPVAGQSN